MTTKSSNNHVIMILAVVAVVSAGIAVLPYANSDIAGAYISSVKTETDANLDNATIATDGTLSTLETSTLSLTGKTDELDWMRQVASPTDNGRMIWCGWDVLSDDVWCLRWANSTSSNGGWDDEEIVETSNTQALQNPTFDLAFEQQSGDAMVVYYESGGDCLKYRIMAAASNDWGSESSCITGTDAGRMIRLAENVNSDEIWMAYETGANDVESCLWSGTSWATCTVHDTDSILAGGVKNTVVMDIAWEQSSEDALIVWYDSTGSLRYNTHTSGSWDTEGEVSASMSAATSKGAQVVMSHQNYIGTDTIGVSTVGGNDKDLWAIVWNGSTFEDFIQESTLTFEAGKGYNHRWAVDPVNDDLYLFWLEKTNLGTKMKIWDEGTNSWGSTQEIEANGQKQPIQTDVKADGTIGVMSGDKNGVVGYGLWQQCDGGTDCSNTANWSTEVEFSAGAQLLDKGQGYTFAYLVEQIGLDPTYLVDLLDVYESESTTLGSGNAICLDVDLEIADSCDAVLKVGHTYRFEIEVDNTGSGAGSPIGMTYESIIADYDVLGNMVDAQIVEYGCEANVDWTVGLVAGTSIITTVGSGTICEITAGGTVEYWIIVRINSDAGSGDQPSATFFVDDGFADDRSTTTTFTVDNVLE